MYLGRRRIDAGKAGTEAVCNEDIGYGVAGGGQNHTEDEVAYRGNQGNGGIAIAHVAQTVNDLGRLAVNSATIYDAWQPGYCHYYSHKTMTEHLRSVYFILSLLWQPRNI